ncbi:flagellar export chaperone FlgN [Pseudoalteromonas sp. T1lg75]|uniref:flagellar export chaperone FlgN n=1 Tax=Pseudoalteromonas sp. T1lg75 TaxID=2077102 RepID=UPI000CF69FF9|nr:flagellar export chaperone FlgN [Pseudoalteromonas sp. T1lg75]
MADSALTLALKQQHNSLNELLVLLNDELTVIAGRSGTELKSITPAKAQALTQIQKQDQHIAQLLARQSERDEQDQQLIDSARELLAQCQQQNQINAHAAHQAQLSVKQLKDILIGAPSSITYAADGAIDRSDNKLVRNLKA